MKFENSFLAVLKEIRDKIALISGTGGTVGIDSKTLAKALLNFNGVGTVSIRSGYNFSSITDYGIGDYSFNFATQMPDSNYILVFTAGVLSNGFFSGVGYQTTYKSVSSCRVSVFVTVSGAGFDSTDNNLLIF